MSEFIYPAEPPKPLPKPLPPKFEKRQKPPKPPKPPKGSTWFIHDPAVYHDPVSRDYFLYCTDAKCYRSQDLISWENIGKVVAEPPEKARNWTHSPAIWAPDIVKVGDEYRLYCSNSSWGVRQSCIFLAVSDRAEGPFLPKDVVLYTSNAMPVNGIDANIIADARTGEQYMVYGSFWGGCHIIPLDKTTGLSKLAANDPGICLARRPEWADRAIEGPYIIYNPDTDYYYLFVSYASLKSDYNIRVGRSRSVTGPYYDHNGRDMKDLSDTDGTLGYMIACGYRFDDDPTGFMGPGHNSVLHDFDGQWYLVSHIRPHNFRKQEPSLLHVRKMLWTGDGWPLVSPEPYAGEQLQPVTWEMVCGDYERIKLQPMIPQGMLNSVRMYLEKDGTGLLGDSIRMTWELTGDHTLTIHYSNMTETFQVMAAWDHEAWKPTLILTGTDQNHICVWGKKFADWSGSRTVKTE